MIKLDVSKWTLKQRILATVAYFDIFDLALNQEEISNLILGEAVSENEVEKTIVDLDELDSQHGLFFLKGREALVHMRKAKVLQSEKLKNKVIKWAWLFRFVPFISGVAVCNYLSLGAVDEDSDIDLLVITKPGRIFMARVCLTLLTHVLGLRRHGNKVSERFCLSFYVTEDAMNFESIVEKPYDIYLIYWMKALLPVCGDDSLWQKMEYENKWVNKYLDFSLIKDRQFNRKSWLDSLRKVVLFAENLPKSLDKFRPDKKIAEYGENLLNNYFEIRHLDRAAKLPKNASVIVNEKMLKYHNNDRRAFFRDEWEKRLERLGFTG